MLDFVRVFLSPDHMQCVIPTYCLLASIHPWLILQVYKSFDFCILFVCFYGKIPTQVPYGGSFVQASDEVERYSEY